MLCKGCSSCPLHNWLSGVTDSEVLFGGEMGCQRHYPCIPDSHMLLSGRGTYMLMSLGCDYVCHSYVDISPAQSSVQLGIRRGGEGGTVIVLWVKDLWKPWACYAKKLSDSSKLYSFVVVKKTQKKTEKPNNNKNKHSCTQPTEIDKC